VFLSKFETYATLAESRTEQKRHESTSGMTIDGFLNLYFTMTVILDVFVINNWSFDRRFCFHLFHLLKWSR